MTTDGVRPEELAELSPEELYALYMEKQVSFGMAGLALDRRRREGRVHVPAAEADIENAGPDQRMIVGPEMGFNVHNLHVFTSGRAGGSERYHTHGDALKHYIKGGGYELVEEERFEVKVGDFCHVPANVWHGTENPRPEPLVFLAAQQFPGTYRQVATPFVHLTAPQAPPEVKDLSEEELGKLEPWPLYLRYLAEQMAFGRVALEVQRRREQKRLLVVAEDAPLMEWGPGRHHIISPEQGFDIYAFHLFMEHVPGKDGGRRAANVVRRGPLLPVGGGRRGDRRAARDGAARRLHVHPGGKQARDAEPERRAAAVHLLAADPRDVPTCRCRRRCPLPAQAGMPWVPGRG